MYDWQDSGIGDNTGNPDHVGIVTKVTGITSMSPRETIRESTALILTVPADLRPEKTSRSLIKKTHRKGESFMMCSAKP